MSAPATCWEDAYRTQVEAIKELWAENAALRKKLDAARKHSALVVTFLAQAQVELVETQHHLNKSKEAQP